MSLGLDRIRRPTHLLQLPVTVYIGVAAAWKDRRKFSPLQIQVLVHEEAVLWQYKSDFGSSAAIGHILPQYRNIARIVAATEYDQAAVAVVEVHS